MQKTDIEELLYNGNCLQIKPQGWSMYPLLVNGRDEVLVEKVDISTLKRGDVVLYRRDTGILVLHRIFRRSKEGFFMVGDNQVEIEGPLQGDRIKGKMVSFIRNGKRTKVNAFWYRCYAWVWLWLRPFRPYIGKIIHKCKRK